MELLDELLTKFGLNNSHIPGSAIGSKWFDYKETIVSYNPATNSMLAEVGQTTVEQLEDIISNSHKMFLQFRDVPAPKRGELVRQIGEKLRQYKKELGLLVALEMGKSLIEGEGEVQEMIDMADFCVGQSRMLYGVTTHSERVSHRLYEQWHPLGVVGVFSAFNFPVAVWAWNAFIAMICGNTVIWKPSPKTPICSVVVHHICSQVLAENAYAEVLALVNFTSLDIAAKLIADKRLPLISFTGSTKVGREIGQQVAKRFGRSILELSGNNAVILDESADLNTAIPSLIFAAVGTAGQRCTTLRRLIIHSNIYDKVVKMLVHGYAQLKIGDPTHINNHIGPLIDNDAVTAYQNAISLVKKQGGEIVFGGNVIEGNGNFVQPTIVKANPNCSIVNTETFAPILYIMKFDTLEEAIAINNQAEHGLSSAIFTQNMRHMEHFLSAHGSDCGIANVNIGTSGAEIGGAFGGDKDSGGGRESGTDCWKSYMRRQTVTVNYNTILDLAQGIKFDLT